MTYSKVSKKTQLKRITFLFSLVFLIASLIFISSIKINYENVKSNDTSVEGINFEPQNLVVPNEPVEGHAIIHFKPEVTAEQKSVFFESFGLTETNSLNAINAVVVNLPEGAEIPESDFISTTEPDYYISVASAEYPTNDTYIENQWALEAIDVQSIWNTEENSNTSKIVAVVDSGVCINHPDLEGRILEGYDFIEEDNVPQDEFGHGCEVSGIIAANSNNEIGIAGVSLKSNILPVRVLDNKGVGTYSDVAIGIIWATDNGADIINLSIGGYNESELLREAVNYAIENGVDVIAAAGNSGINDVMYPAKYEGVIAVGSVGTVNENGEYESSSFSNYGAKVEKWAPGEGLYTTSLDGEYKYVNGTSYSTAIVSGGGEINFISNISTIINFESVGDNVTSQIVNGVDSEFERAVSIGSQGFHLCGGTLLNNYWVLTAKHCVESSIPNEISVRTGSNSLNNGTVVGVDRIIQNRTIDLALLKLDTSVEINSSLSLIALENDPYVLNVTGQVSTYGWGITGENQTNSLNLQKADLELVNRDECWGPLGENQQGPYLCARAVNNQISGVCNHDSGGPLIYKNQLIGVVHGDKGDGLCGEATQLFTRVSIAESWINDNISSNDCTLDNGGKGTILYKGTNCTLSSTNLDIGKHNFSYWNPLGFNDSTQSISVKEGYSVRVYENHNQSGSNRCITSDMWDLSKDYYRIGDTWKQIYNYDEASKGFNISSIEVFNDNSCGNGPNACVLGLGDLSAQSCSDDGAGSSDGGTSGSTNPGNSANGVSLISLSPSPSQLIAQGQYFNPKVVIQTSGFSLNCSVSFLENSNDNLFGTWPTQGCKDIGNNRYEFYFNTPMQAPYENGVYSSQWKIWNGSSFVGPIIDIKFGVGEGIEEYKGSVKLFNDANYNNLALEVSNVVKTSNDPSPTLYSIEIPDSWSVKIYDQDDLSGNSRCFNSSVTNLQDHEDWQNRIESIELFTEDVCDKPQGPIWDMYVYDGESKWWDRDIPTSTARCHEIIEREMISEDFLDTNPCGGGADINNWVAEFIGTRYFEEGDYVFNIKHNDGLQIFINGEQKLFRSSSGESAVCEPFHLSGNVELTFILREESGDSNIDVSWTDDISACNDVTPPIGYLTAPENYTINNGSEPILLSAFAEDNSSTDQTTSGVSKIDFYAKHNEEDWSLIGTDLEAPYEYSWDTSSVAEGYYWLATDTFDTSGNNSGITTDENFWRTVIVDKTKPVSQMSSLQSEQSSFDFIVSWSGSDNLTRINFDVEFSVGCSGDWVPWIGYRSGTSARFSGTPGETYCFRVRAIDQAGNIGDWSESSTSTKLPTCDNGQFLAEYFDNKNLSGTPIHIECENEINHDWGLGSHGFSGSDFGDGIDGELVVSGFLQDNPTDAVVSSSNGTNQIFANNPNFRAGQKIFIYQVQGADAGTFQKTHIESYDAGNGIITTTDPLLVNYLSDSENAAQVIVVNQYTDVTVTEGATWKAKEWDGQTGGILLFEANGNITISGEINATGSGFRGGKAGQNPYGMNNISDNIYGDPGEGYLKHTARTSLPSGNGGGGGFVRAYNEQGNGGGGGSNGTYGLNGSSDFNTGTVGQGAPSVGTADMEKIFLGGAGGGGGFGDAESYAPPSFYAWGNGGDGGGIIFAVGENIKINDNGQIINQGIIGQPGSNDQGAGGSGAGGSVLLSGNTVDIGTSNISAPGVKSKPGGTGGSGGTSGHGRINVEYLESYSGTNFSEIPIYFELLNKGEDNFSVRWSGVINFLPRDYKFISTSDDGARLFINDSLVMDDWKDGLSEVTTNKYVGTDTKIVYEYYENIGNAEARLQIIPGENLAPVIEDIPTQIASQFSSFEALNLNLYGYDPNGDTVLWSFENGENIQLSIDPFNFITVDKPEDWIGEEVITFTATDTWGESTTIKVIFKVIENLGPEISEIPTQITDEDIAFIPINLNDYVSDPDTNDELTFTISGEQNIQFEINSENMLIAIPTENWNGTETITLTVSDLAGEEVSTTIELMVNPVNDLPEITSVPTTEITETDQFVYQIVAPDVENDLLSYEITGANLPADMHINENGVLIWDTDYDDFGTYEITVIVNDPEGSVSQTFILNVSDSNRTPEFNLINNQTIKEDGTFESFDLDDYVNDPDGDVLTYSFVGNSELQVGIDTDNIVSVYAQANWNGVETVTFTVDDGKGGTVSQEVVFTVLPVNDAPVIQNEPILEALEDQLYVYNLDAIDVDGDSLNYTLVEAPSGMIIDSNGQINWTPTNSEVGEHLVIVKVTDDELSDSKEFILTVINVNDAPTEPTNPTPTNGAVDQSINSINLSWDASTDEDGDIVYYDIYLGESINDLSLLSAAFTNPEYSLSTLDPDITYYWQVIAYDNNGGITYSNIWSFTTGMPLIAANPDSIVLILERDASGIPGLNSVDEKINPGEKIKLSFDVTNNTENTFKKLDVEVQSSSPYITMENFKDQIKNLKPGETKSIFNSIGFIVSPDAPIGEELEFLVTYNDKSSGFSVSYVIKMQVEKSI